MEINQRVKESVEPLTKMIELLESYIAEYESLDREVTKETEYNESYKELLALLNGDFASISENATKIICLLKALYEDATIYVNEFKEIIKSQDLADLHLRRVINRIISDANKNYRSLGEKKRRVYFGRFMYPTAKRVIIRFEKKLPIDSNGYDISNLKKILKYYVANGTISNKDELILINEIELYNRKLFSKEKNNPQEQAYAEGLSNKLLNILEAGFQPHDEVEIDDAKRKILDNIVRDIFINCHDMPNNELINYIEAYRSYEVQGNEFNYILTKVLDALLDSLITYYELLTDDNVYRAISDRKDIINNYYKTLDKYLIILKYYDQINTFTIVESGDEPIPEVEKETKTLVYSHSPNSAKTKLVADLKDVPEEYYASVKDLIDRFKSGSLHNGEYKPLKNNRNLNAYTELRGDQIRILVRHMRGNIYCIMGVGVKKDDNDLPMYNRMANRFIPKVDTDENLQKELELAQVAETELANIVKEKGRKGNRNRPS